MDRFKSLVLLAGLTIAAAAAPQSAEPARYRIDAAQSEIYWQVYKAGAFARLGHNHIISVEKLDGLVQVASALPQSRFEMTIPVADLVIDDPALRAGKGEDFASEPSEKDIDGTRRNMLGDKVLNGEQFPLLRIEGRNLSAVSMPATIDLTIGILGREVELTVPATVEIDAESVVASGTFSLSHADLGLEPFSVMMGALQVGEQIDFFYRIHAVRAD